MLAELAEFVNTFLIFQCVPNRFLRKFASSLYSEHEYTHTHVYISKVYVYRSKLYIYTTYHLILCFDEFTQSEYDQNPSEPIGYFPTKYL